MTFETLLLFSIAFSIAAVVPGPGVIAVVARALGSGFWPAMPMAVGMVLGDLIFLTLVALGLAAVAEQIGGFFAVVKFVGAAYLIYLGYRMWAAPVETTAISPIMASAPLKMGIVGLVVTLSNPKTVLFFLALLPTLIDVRTIDGTSLIELGLIMVMIDVVVLAAYSAVAARTRLLFLSSRLRHRLNRCAGASLIGAGGAVAAS